MYRVLNQRISCIEWSDIEDQVTSHRIGVRVVLKDKFILSQVTDISRMPFFISFSTCSHFSFGLPFGGHPYKNVHTKMIGHKLSYEREEMKEESDGATFFFSFLSSTVYRLDGSNLSHLDREFKLYVS